MLRIEEGKIIYRRIAMYCTRGGETSLVPVPARASPEAQRAHEVSDNGEVRFTCGSGQARLDGSTVGQVLEGCGMGTGVFAVVRSANYPER